MDNFKCEDCEEIVNIPNDIKEGEIIECKCCGLEYIYRKGKFIQLTFDGEDWGE